MTFQQHDGRAKKYFLLCLWQVAILESNEQ